MCICRRSMHLYIVVPMPTQTKSTFNHSRPTFTQLNFVNFLIYIQEFLAIGAVGIPACNKDCYFLMHPRYSLTSRHPCRPSLSYAQNGSQALLRELFPYDVTAIDWLPLRELRSTWFRVVIDDSCDPQFNDLNGAPTLDIKEPLIGKATQSVIFPECRRNNADSQGKTQYKTIEIQRPY